jgi:predicted secreted Zn-dependent protease
MAALRTRDGSFDDEKEKTMGSTDTKAAYTEKMQGMLRDADAEVKKLEAPLDPVKAEARAKYQQHVDEARSKVSAAQAKLQQLRAADQAQWEKTKVEVERSLSEVKQSIQRAASKLQQG